RASGVGRWALGVEERENRSSGPTPLTVAMAAPAVVAASDLADYLEEAARHLAEAQPASASAAPRNPAALASQDPTTNAQCPTPNAQRPTPDAPSAQRLTPNARFTGSVLTARERMLRAAPPVSALQGRPWSPQYWDLEVADVLARLDRTVYPLEPL